VPKASLSIISGEGKDAEIGNGIVVRNPISADYEVMRTSLLPGLADALRRNLARGLASASLFEVGPIVRRPANVTDAPVERQHAAGILAGHQAGWLKPGEPLDFYDLKRVVEILLRGFGIAFADFEPTATASYFHPGVSAQIRSKQGAILGALGELHPAIARKLGIDTEAFFFEVEIAELTATIATLQATAPPRFPAVTRDVSFWIDVATTAAAQRAAFLAADEPLLCDIAVLEDFRDPKHAPAGKKGVLWSMTYRAADRTLTDADADEAHRRVVSALSSRFPIQIR
jgi:phenylalanyl-tRNA synthetase beta chain